MEQEYIDIEDFCQYYAAEISFIHSLRESGLISVSVEKEHYFIPMDEMPRLEKFVRMHYDLDINLAGLETIDHLLQKLETLQLELKRLQSNATSI